MVDYRRPEYQLLSCFCLEKKKEKKLRQLQDENGNVVVGEQLKNFIANHYQQLFMSHAGNDFEEVLNCVQPRVTQEMNDFLLMPFTGDEIWCVLESIGGLKAPSVEWWANAGRVEPYNYCVNP